MPSQTPSASYASSQMTWTLQLRRQQRQQSCPPSCHSCRRPRSERAVPAAGAAAGAGARLATMMRCESVVVVCVGRSRCVQDCVLLHLQRGVVLAQTVLRWPVSWLQKSPHAEDKNDAIVCVAPGVGVLCCSVLLCPAQDAMLQGRRMFAGGMNAYGMVQMSANDQLREAADRLRRLQATAAGPPALKDTLTVCCMQLAVFVGRAWDGWE